MRAQEGLTFDGVREIVETLQAANPAPSGPTNKTARRNVDSAIRQLAEHFGISETEAAEALLAACFQPKRSPSE